MVTGAGDAYQLDVRNGSGAIVSRIVVSTSRVPVTSAMRDTMIATIMHRVRTTRGEGSGMTLTFDELEKSERDTPVADSLPAYNQLFSTPNTTLWVVGPFVPGTS